MEGKKIKGRKRHIVTDIEGHLLYVKVHAANRYDSVVGCEVIKEALERYPSIKGVCGDAGYRKTMEKFVMDVLKRRIDISVRLTSGWAVMAKRWIIERTLVWFNFFRRLSKEYEIRTKYEEAVIMISHSRILLAQLSNP